ncbi:hypothetical protein GCM10014713_63630 [Streptomyces purpureus]|uniref:Uncharacterized protein n=1 Tax=Streptomyces purpureus TaxID=1951 RepID=A0A918HIL6_9ACTN|nr:hypothetical protein GCM10014713_63630 [Streptomyces purpureus]
MCRGTVHGVDLGCGGRYGAPIPLTPLRGHGRIGPPEGDDGPDGRECAMAAGSFEGAGAHPAGAEVLARLTCPTCGSAHVAQVLGDNGGVSYVCTACGHSWS